MNRFLIENGVLKKYTPHNDFMVNIKSIAIPVGVTTIERDAFGFSANCIDIIIPETVSYIDEKAFGFIKYINVYGKPGSYAHQYVENSKSTLPYFTFFSNSIPELPSPEPDKDRKPPFSCTDGLKDLWLWEKKNDDVVEQALPLKLFDLSKTESVTNADSVSSTYTSIILCDNGTLKKEMTSISYSAHNVAHSSAPMRFHSEVSFDELPYLISSSGDSNAKKYIGMNSENWKDYLKINISVKTSKYPIVRFGKYYEQYGLPEMKPIDWYALDYKHGYLLLLAKDGLDTYQWHDKLDKEYIPDWETCDLNRWLNTEFINIAFDPNEKEAINHRVSLLSSDEVNKYLSDDPAMQLRPSKYAMAKETCLFYAENVKKDADESLVGYSVWWHRNESPNKIKLIDTYHSVSCTNSNGMITGWLVDKENVCVRPAIWVKQGYFGISTDLIEN